MLAELGRARLPGEGRHWALEEQPSSRQTALAPAGGTGSAGSHPAPHQGVAQESPALQFTEAGPGCITKLQASRVENLFFPSTTSKPPSPDPCRSSAACWCATAPGTAPSKPRVEGVAQGWQNSLCSPEATATPPMPTQCRASPFIPHPFSTSLSCLSSCGGVHLSSHRAKRLPLIAFHFISVSSRVPSTPLNMLSFSPSVGSKPQSPRKHRGPSCLLDTLQIMYLSWLHSTVQCRASPTPFHAFPGG